MPTLGIYTVYGNDKRRAASEERPRVKTTKIMQNIANPRRTTLAHLEDAEELAVQPAEEQGEQTGDLPASTANPQRTVLVDAPAQ